MKLIKKISSLFRKVVTVVPAPIQRLVPDSPAYKKHKMQELYVRAYSAGDKKENVLFWVPGGMSTLLHVEGTFAAALKLRGAEVNLIICDGAYSACVKREIGGSPVSEWKQECDTCRKSTSEVLETLGLPYSFIGDFITKKEKKELDQIAQKVSWDKLDNFRYDGIDLSSNVRSAIVRYYQGYEPDNLDEIVKEYSFSALVTLRASSRAYEHINPSKVMMSHGIYVDWGPALRIAHNRHIPIVAWMNSYIRSRFYLRQIEDTRNLNFHNMSEKAWDECRESPLKGEQYQRLEQYLSDRYHKRESFDMRTGLPAYVGDIESIYIKLNIDRRKPTWAIMAHINWDCVFDYSPMTYSNFDDWIVETIKLIIPQTDVNWLVKIHPAEANYNPNSGVEKLIEQRFPSLPEHIRVVSAREDISPLELFQVVNGGITAFGTSGLELLLLGKPVILAGEAYYGSKGFTYDGNTLEKYEEFVRKAASLPVLDHDQLLLARKFAYCYFIRRQVPIPVLRDPESMWYRFQFNKRELLLPGNDPFLDFICNKIQSSEDFIMDDDLVDLADELV